MRNSLIGGMSLKAAQESCTIVVGPGALAENRELFVGPGALAGAAVSPAQSYAAAAALGCRNSISFSSWIHQVRLAVGIFCATLREIFDESAYRRFLQRHHQQASRSSYAAFLRDHAHRAHRPRCC